LQVECGVAVGFFEDAVLVSNYDYVGGYEFRLWMQSWAPKGSENLWKWQNHEHKISEKQCGRALTSLISASFS
jgi:hypothetical protein